MVNVDCKVLRLQGGHHSIISALAVACMKIRFAL